MKILNRVMRTPRGVILMITLLVVFFLTLLVTAMLLMSRHNLAFSQVYADRVQGMMAAEAGADYALYRLEGDNTWQANAGVNISYPVGAAIPALMVVEAGKTATGTLADGSTFQITFDGSDHPSKNNLSGDSAQTGYNNRVVPPYCADIVVHGWGGNGQARVLESIYRKSVAIPNASTASGLIKMQADTFFLGSADPAQISKIRSNYPSPTPGATSAAISVTDTAGSPQVDPSASPTMSPAYAFLVKGTGNMQYNDKLLTGDNPAPLPSGSVQENQAGTDIPVINAGDMGVGGGDVLSPGIYIMSADSDGNTKVTLLSSDGSSVIGAFDSAHPINSTVAVVNPVYDAGGNLVTPGGIAVSGPQQVTGSITFVDKSDYLGAASGGESEHGWEGGGTGSNSGFTLQLTGANASVYVRPNTSAPPDGDIPPDTSGVPLLGHRQGEHGRGQGRIKLKGKDAAVENGSFNDYSATITGEGAIYAEASVTMQGASYSATPGNMAVFAGGNVNVLPARKRGDDTEQDTRFKGLIYTKGNANFTGRNGQKLGVQGAIVAVNPDDPSGDTVSDSKGNIFLLPSRGDSGEYAEVHLVYDPSYLALLNKLCTKQPLIRYYWQDQSSSPKF